MIASSKPVVLLSHQMLSPMQQALEAQGYEVARRWELTPQQAAEVRVIIQAGEIPLPAAFLEGLPKLGLIACVSVGYDGVDVPWCRARGVEVTHAHGLNAEDVADHAIGLMIAGWRNIVVGDAAVRGGSWAEGERMGARPGLRGRKLGVMGMGSIGEAVAVRAQAFGMEARKAQFKRDEVKPFTAAPSLSIGAIIIIMVAILFLLIILSTCSGGGGSGGGYRSSGGSYGGYSSGGSHK